MNICHSLFPRFNSKYVKKPKAYIHNMFFCLFDIGIFLSFDIYIYPWFLCISWLRLIPKKFSRPYCRPPGGRELAFDLFIFSYLFSRAAGHDGESCFWGRKRRLMGEGFGRQMGRGIRTWLAEEDSKQRRRRKEKKTEQLREPGQSCWWRGNLQVRSPAYSITFSSFWLLDVKRRSIISVDSWILFF